MTPGPRPGKQRFLVPEVVQTSAMDCGPACLKGLLGGFGISASYGRLREACQIDLDGTSIDTIEEAAVEMGLDAEQILIPADHLLLPAARTLPAMVVVRLPNGLTHFVIAWRTHGPLLQVMDPATGRRWPGRERFLSQLYLHAMPVPAADWREWAGSDDFLAPLRARLRRIGAGGPAARRLLEEALGDPAWRSLAALDASVRMTAAVVDSGGLARGRQAARLAESFFERSRRPEAEEGGGASAGYWSVRPRQRAREASHDEAGDEPEELIFRGALLVRVRGRKARADAGAGAAAGPEEPAAPPELSPELAAALTEKPQRPGRELFRMLRAGGAGSLLTLLLMLLVGTGGVVFEALLFRGFFDVGRDLSLADQRLAGMAVLTAFLAILLLLDLPIAEGVLRFGRHLEARLRVAFLEKIPRLGDRYFRSRLTSDMAERCHSVHRLRRLPDLAEGLGRAVLELVLTTGALIWLDPGGAPLAVAALAVAVGLPLLFMPLLQERDLRARIHAGALSRFYLDALLGLVPLRTHSADRAVSREHENLLVEWAGARLARERAVVALDVVLLPLLLGLVAWLLVGHLERVGLGAAVLLLVFWSLRIFTLGRLVTLLLANQYPSYRNVTLRLLEPLGAREEPAAEEAGVAGGAEAARGASFAFRGVSARAGGQTILEGIDLEVEAGSHVAIVGPSGAGKSSLVGLLLGWHRAAEGSLLVDGEPLDPPRLSRLRRRTAWVDPQVQLWNRPFLYNLLYGDQEGSPEAIGRVVRQADLVQVLQQLPDGFQTPLGEGGGLVSGGEGQRVRLARAMLRDGVRLAVLDEPFRGLARDQRRTLLRRARELWKDATLLCITHDVGETRGFGRVLVVDKGRIVEDGPPAELAARPGSRYGALLAAEEEVQLAVWFGPRWRRLHLEGGRVAERAAGRGR